MTDTKTKGTCVYCHRDIVLDGYDGWVDPEAPIDSDDSIWRTQCDRSPYFDSAHEPRFDCERPPFLYNGSDGGKRAVMASLRAPHVHFGVHFGGQPVLCVTNDQTKCTSHG